MEVFQRLLPARFLAGAVDRVAMGSDDQGAGGGVGAPLIWVSGFAAVVCSAVICVLLENAVPRDPGPVYALFPYDGEVVAIGLVGGLLPLLASVAMFVASAGRHLDGARPHPFRSRAYWVAVLAAALLVTLLFTASQGLYGGVGLSKLWAILLLLAACATGAGYWWLRGRRLGAAWGAAECYVLGTLGSFGSDAVRTLTGLARLPGEAVVWGGGGLFDIVFWFGLYVSLSFLSLYLILAVVIRAYGTMLGAGKSAQ
jgi:hypothetical protein